MALQECHRIQPRRSLPEWKIRLHEWPPLPRWRACRYRRKTLLDERLRLVLPHRAVAALIGEISLGKKLFVRRKLCLLKGGAIPTKDEGSVLAIPSVSTAMPPWASSAAKRVATPSDVCAANTGLTPKWPRRYFPMDWTV